MDFHEGNGDAGERVTNGKAGVAVRSRVHERAVGTTAQRVNRLDNLAFPIVLRERELDSMSARVSVP